MKDELDRDCGVRLSHLRLKRDKIDKEAGPLAALSQRASCVNLAYRPVGIQSALRVYRSAGEAQNSECTRRDAAERNN